MKTIKIGNIEGSLIFDTEELGDGFYLVCLKNGKAVLAASKLVVQR